MSNPASQSTFPFTFFSGSLLLGLAGLFFTFFEPLAQRSQAKNWATVPCQILSSEIKRQRLSRSSRYSADVSYLYHFDGREYRGNRYRFLQDVECEASEAAVARYPVGSTASCFVNPKNPSESVLDLGIGQLALGLFFLIFAVIGAVGIFTVLFGSQGGRGAKTQQNCQLS